MDSKAASKISIQETAKATEDLVRNKTMDKISRAGSQCAKIKSKTSSQIKDETSVGAPRWIPNEKYTPPESNNKLI